MSRINQIASDIGTRLAEFSRLAKAIIVVGIFARLLIWSIYPPSWKAHAHLYPMHVGFVQYASDFTSYVPGRLPFVNILSYVFFELTEPLLGVRGLATFTVLVSIVSLPFFYEGVRRLFEARAATFGLLLYALYPKLIVMAGRGMAEAATTAFIVFTLYAIARSFETDTLYWYFIAGLMATMAYLMYLSTILFAVMLSIVIYLWQVKSTDGGGWWWVPDSRSWAYNVTPGIVGVLYLIYGPVRELPVFVETSYLFQSGYGPVESVVRYVSYMFFDFWWHTRGFDTESGVSATIHNLEAALGTLWPLYLIGWGAMTVLLSVVLFFGVAQLVREKSGPSSFVLLWLATYASVKLYENLGWQGYFQTRHFIGIFPALAIAFGIGLASLSCDLSWVSDRQSSTLNPDTIVASVVGLFLIVLLLNASINGVMKPDERIDRATIDELQKQAQSDDVVAVTSYTDYTKVLIYSRGQIVPDILLLPGATIPHDQRPLGAVINIEPEAIGDTEVDYIEAQVSCHPLRPPTIAFLDAAKENGQVTFEQSIHGPGDCESLGIIVKLERSIR